MNSDLKYLLIIIILGLGLMIPSFSAESIQLSNSIWTVYIIPDTLGIAAILKDGQKVIISDNSISSKNVSNIKKSPNTIQWNLDDLKLSIQAELNGNKLQLQFLSLGGASIQWPVLNLTTDAKTLVWPKGEGYYIPVDNNQWKTYLDKDEWNPNEGLSMPFWGIVQATGSITYILDNPFHSSIQFTNTSTQFTLRGSHEFVLSDNSCQFDIYLNPDNSPVGSAQIYREWLQDKGEFVTLQKKIQSIPKAEWLLGAPNVYLWGDDYFTRLDVKPKKMQAFCKRLIQESSSPNPTLGKRIKRLMTPDDWKQVLELSTTAYSYVYLENGVATGITKTLGSPDFYDPMSFKNITIPEQIKGLIKEDSSSLKVAGMNFVNGYLLYSAYTDLINPPDTWGNGLSIKMLDQFKEAGFDRMRLCFPGWTGINKRPEFAREADKRGYLIGTYDSFNSIHDPALKGTEATWETAQFDKELYNTGAIVKRDGNPFYGFNKKGYRLSPIAARPSVERRINENLDSVPYNFYFIDCDAFGEYFDDYSPLHSCSQAQDAQERKNRLAWISTTHHLVISSEGGNAYMVPVLHNAEGIFDPNWGWGDPDLKDKKSSYYLGSYFPPDQPSIFFKPVPLKDEYKLFYYPEYRIPLYETVFHDSIVVTHHWSNSSLKYPEMEKTTALTELLYRVPPLYHLNMEEFKKLKGKLKQHYAFFSPLHRKTGLLPMTSFAWLSSDHLVQKAVFGETIELIANYQNKGYHSEDITIPPMSIRSRDLKTGEIEVYTP